ncbi:hypothetical protein L1987_52059 [Smallanthus sonchifolius]|uniref:Uncharacterized protein n=1 Tax=Smallanthus sonchifolius TaxID=185202 RepID=A0ACB9ESP6_9ASTR|nr:hypothetical protein L1987_52059 [Smallanthus sonchifolius]
MSVSDISELFPAMTLEDASLKLKKVEETPLKKEPSMMVEQLSWKNFIGVSNRSSWIHADKRKPSWIDADKRRIGVDRRSGVEKRRRRILDKWFAAIIRFPPVEVTVVYGDEYGWGFIGHRRKQL